MGYVAVQWSQTHQQLNLWMAQEKQIKILYWPSQSPDWNPIEYIYVYIYIYTQYTLI